MKHIHISRRISRQPFSVPLLALQSTVLPYLCVSDMHSLSILYRFSTAESFQQPTPYAPIKTLRTY